MGMRNVRWALLWVVAVVCSPALAGISIPAGASVDVADGRIALAGGDVLVRGTLRLGNGQIVDVGDFRVLAGSADLGSGVIRLVGDWENRATLIAGTSRVEFLDGPAAIRAILGSTRFATLSLVSANGTRYRVESGSTQRIAQLLEIVGEGVPIQIDVTNPGSIARFDLLDGGSQEIDNVGVSDVHAVGQPLAPDQTNQGGNGNDDGWFGNGGGSTPPPLPAPPLVVPALSDVGLALLALLFGALAWRRLDPARPQRLRA